MFIDLRRSMNLVRYWLEVAGWKKLQADLISYQLVRYEFEGFFTAKHKQQATSKLIKIYSLIKTLTRFNNADSVTITFNFTPAAKG